MKIALFKESRPGETRVALTPDAVKAYVADGWQVDVERAGAVAGRVEAAAARGLDLLAGVEKLIIPSHGWLNASSPPGVSHAGSFPLSVWSTDAATPLHG